MLLKIISYFLPLLSRRLFIIRWDELIPFDDTTLVSDKKIISALLCAIAAIFKSKLEVSPVRLSELQFCILKDSGVTILFSPAMENPVPHYNMLFKIVDGTKRRAVIIKSDSQLHF